MKMRTLAALLAAVHAAPALAVDPPKSAPNALRTPVRVTNLVVSVEVSNVAAVPGEKKTFTATLKGVPSPGGKTITFRVPAAGLQKSVQTDAQGKATTEFVLPEIAQGSSPIEGIWDGDAERKNVVGSGKLTMIKAPTKVDLDAFYSNSPGGPHGSVGGSMMASVKRAHDGQVLKKAIVLTINGDSRTLPPNDHHAAPLGPPDASGKWVVKVQFEGDAACAASAAEKTLVKPK